MLTTVLCVTSTSSVIIYRYVNACEREKKKKTPDIKGKYKVGTDVVRGLPRCRVGRTLLKTHTRIKGPGRLPLLVGDN